MQRLQIIKIGGNIVNDADNLHHFLNHFTEVSYPKLLVHGGGNAASDLCKKLNIPIKMSEGRRITDAPALDVAIMVYAGLINKKIVAGLQARSCNALGLSGADLNTIPAKKRNRPDIDFGFVGDIKADELNTYFIRRLLDEQIVPVFPAITHDTKGQLLNTNADTIASCLSIALSGHYEVTLTYCFDKPGVLEHIDDDESLISQISRDHFATLKDSGAIHEGMIPKLDTAFEALLSNVQHVHIKHARNLNNDIGTQLLL